MCCSATREMFEKELMSLNFDIYENAIDELSFAFSAMISFLDCLHEEVVDVGNNIFPGAVYDKRSKNGSTKK